MFAPANPAAGRYTPVVVLAVTLAVFALVVGYVSFWLRDGLREQILAREAEALTEVASLQLSNEAEALAALGITDAPGELLHAVLKTSKLRGVFAVRVFDAERNFGGALPLPWSEQPPNDADWRSLTEGKPLARLHRRESAAEVIGLAPASDAGAQGEPLLETWLPLRRAEGAALAGAAQMWTDGRALAREFATLDRRLWKQASLAWLTGAILISALLSWTFRRIEAANHDLRLRSEDLWRANRELALAAKASALGAVTAHLMHELKNPVAGLEEFVASQTESGARNGNGGELAAASELTRRLRTMINDVATVMRDEQTGTEFELSGSDIIELATGRAADLATARGVTLHGEGASQVMVDGRRGNLVRLVLHNLLQNAIEASASGASVRLGVRAAPGQLVFSVSDAGPGLAPSIQERLFHPVRSTKPGGSGLGLALSQQLARQAGGRIQLATTGPGGTTFEVVLDLAEET